MRRREFFAAALGVLGAAAAPVKVKAAAPDPPPSSTKIEVFRGSTHWPCAKDVDLFALVNSLAPPLRPGWATISVSMTEDLKTGEVQWKAVRVKLGRAA